MKNDSHKANGLPPISPISVYNRAIQVMGVESVHDAIVKGGPDILYRGVPFVVIAARWQKIAQYKKASREILTDDLDGEDSRSLDIWNPYVRIEKNESLRIIVECLAEFPDEDIIAVWGKFNGLTDAEIKKKWAELKIGPRNPKLTLIRKRRERTLKRLRTMVHERLSHTK